ncbi:MAG TPA: radical SAM protein [bacterium]|nr:radical SAM protein [bacterium]
MRLVLINPRLTESFWSFAWENRYVTRQDKAIIPPMGLAILAALTPKDWDVTILDEDVEEIDWDIQADVVGVCGMNVQWMRQCAIIRHFRARGIHTVAGGSYASLVPELYAEVVDTVIAGEAERTWPRFCSDFQRGKPGKFYRETGEVDMTASPQPRYDLLKLDRYRMAGVQYSRGCPYVCEFCEIIVVQGRKPRTKTVEQVGLELDFLRRAGVKDVFLVDDNFIGSMKSAKTLLSYLDGYQRTHRYRFRFGTQCSVNMTADLELMGLFQRANFDWVFLGIETPNTESLKEARKTQNLGGDLLSAIRTVYAYGMDIYAGFIVGFDSDDKTIFDRQFDFILRSGVALTLVGLLTALPGTPLFARLQKAGRLRDMQTMDPWALATNVVPLRMTYEELIEGYKDLIWRLLEDETVYRRLVAKLRYFKRPGALSRLSIREKLSYGYRLLRFGILPGGPKRFYYFVLSLLREPGPRRWSVVVADWMTAISFQTLVNRHFRRSE